RTGTSNKDAPRPKQSHRPVINLFVPAQGSFNAVLVLGECRWVENDRVVVRSLLEPVAQKVESIGCDTFDIDQTVIGGVHPQKLDGVSGDIHCLDACTNVADLYGKSSGVGKGIESAAVSVPARRGVIVLLVQVRPGFLPRRQR